MTKSENSSVWKELAEVAIKAAKETPRGYFAPAIVFWRWVSKMYDSVLYEDLSSKGK